MWGVKLRAGKGEGTETGSSSEIEIWALDDLTRHEWNSLGMDFGADEVEGSISV